MDTRHVHESAPARLGEPEAFLIGLAVLAATISLAFGIGVLSGSFLVGFAVTALLSTAAALLLDRRTHRGDSPRRPHRRARAGS